ncbi:hypothetical protein [Helicobacter fennelliae]|uniref:hypothetical protein n=1 Tax=Helicobacter fennelliae TaxID=215 RepID=UPI000E048353|nr:hypothetical protein [Helicobacter fennelliae]STQ83687.1 putative integral membrane protein [Helicobacter fennelliae]
MRVSNFINLSVVAGFFIGLIFGLIKFNEPELVLFLTIVVTITMYLISLSMATIYIHMIEPKRSLLSNKKLIERQLDFFDSEFDMTEKQARSVRQFIKNFDFSEELEEDNKS